MFVIDVNTGDYEIDDDDPTTTLRLRDRTLAPSRKMSESAFQHRTA